MEQHGIRIEPCRIHDRALELRDGDDRGAAFAAELGRVIADVAEPLHDDALAFEARGETHGLHVFCD